MKVCRTIGYGDLIEYEDRIWIQARVKKKNQTLLDFSSYVSKQWLEKSRVHTSVIDKKG